ncbi:hypothetical protein QYF61_009260 [Mycteria americana]|uniref:Uncharacterized protein n=1 Tax=Mycteria americana TaxID=33587 RepID=A0AAN7SJ58_MYCAM|nr:hypothetical protein QYF61_009260 [Mycteria americana]
MDTGKFSSYGRTRLFEGLPKGAGPRGMAAEGGRQIVDTPGKPSAYGDKTSKLEELCTGLAERLTQVEEEIKAVPGKVTQTELQEEEEYKKLEKKITELEARNKELLSKAMGMHKDSENMNDPSRLSAVLQRYEMLRLQDWEKLRSSAASYWTYKTGSNIIKKLFDACEKDIQERIAKISEILGIPTLNDTATNSKQDPPVKAVWNLQESLLEYIEHVDKKDWEHWREPAFLWPIMKCGEQVIVKGVVWDEK